MFAWWGTVVTRARTLLLVVGLAFGAFAGIWGTGVFDRLDGDSSLDDPSSESQLINDRVTEELGRQSTDLVALYSSDTLSVDDTAFERAVVDVTDAIRDRSEVELVTTYYETEAENLVSTDGRATYVPIRFVEGTDDDVISEVRDQLTAFGLTTQVGGSAAIDLDINDRIGPDIAKAELIAMPILLIALLIVLGNVVAALIPLVIGGLAILGAFTVLRVISAYTELSAFSINIITILGLGLAVDYGLFMVSRFREELHRGESTADAVSRTMATAGRTVAVSGVVVGLSLSSLLIFPQVLLRSMGLGGAAAVLVAMVASLTVLPALLAALGPRIDAGRLPWAGRRRVLTVAGALDHGWWARVARSVMRRPVLYVVGVLAVLLVLAAPLAGVQFGGIDERALPAGTESRVVSERLARQFSDASVQPIRVLVSGAPLADAEGFAADIAAIPGVRGAAISDNEGTASMITVTYDGEPSSLPARGIVEDIRALDSPADADVMVGGASASVVDQLASLTERLPWMVLLVAGITFVLLAVAFGSLVVPAKAIVMNVVSLAAAFGVVTWIFQDGHLSGPLGFTPTGYVEASQPILMAAILFGLSMDYEVFLLSRVRERWDALGDNTAAVASGVQRTGGIITAAAVLLCVVTGAFATSGITFIKMVGVGMFVALIVDATLVRLLLVPATMRLLGRHNWWAPGFLSRLYGRYGVREEGAEPRSATGVSTSAATPATVGAP